MIVEIKHNGEIYEVIKVNNAYIFGINLSNKGERIQTLDIDELQFDKPFIFVNRVLPNGGYLELPIIKTDKELIEKYKGLPTLSINFNGVTVEATM